MYVLDWQQQQREKPEVDGNLTFDEASRKCLPIWTVSIDEHSFSRLYKIIIFFEFKRDANVRKEFTERAKAEESLEVKVKEIKDVDMQKKLEEEAQQKLMESELSQLIENVISSDGKCLSWVEFFNHLRCHSQIGTRTSGF